MTTAVAFPYSQPEVSTLLATTGQQILASLSQLRDHLAARRITRPLLVLDRRALTAARLLDELTDQLSHLPLATFEDFTPNPTSDEAEHAAAAAHHHRADAVIAVGGGTTLDVAKLAAFAANAPRDNPRVICRGEIQPDHPILPLIVAPTTSGTGSEGTHFAAIYVEGRKTSIAHARLQPDTVILDHRLHLAMPAHIAAQTGLDALGQSLESLWAVGRTYTSAAFATAAAKLVHTHLTASVLTPDPHHRSAMMIAAHLAGHAINISKTTAAHALSYQLTQRFGIPHGHAVALTLGHLAYANTQLTPDTCNDPRGSEAVQQHVRHAASLLDTTPQELPRHIAHLMQTIGLPNSLKQAGVTPESLDELAGRVDPVRLSNNPRNFTAAEIHQLLTRAL